LARDLVSALTVTSATSTIDATARNFGTILPYSQRRLNTPETVVNPMTGGMFVEAASQAFKAGDMLYISTWATGSVTEEAHAGTTPIVGFALQDATGVTGALVPIGAVSCGEVYSMCVVSATATNTNPADVGTMALNSGLAYPIGAAQLTLSTGEVKYASVVDYDTSDDFCRVVVIGLDPRFQQVATDIYARALVMFPPFMIDDGVRLAYRNLQFDI